MNFNSFINCTEIYLHVRHWSEFHSSYDKQNKVTNQTQISLPVDLNFEVCVDLSEMMFVNSEVIAQFVKTPLQ